MTEKGDMANEPDKSDGIADESQQPGSSAGAEVVPAPIFGPGGSPQGKMRPPARLPTDPEVYFPGERGDVPEEAGEIAALLERLGEENDPDKIANIVIQAGIPRDQVANQLRAIGKDEEVINDVMERAGEMAEPLSPEEIDEENKNPSVIDRKAKEEALKTETEEVEDLDKTLDKDNLSKEDAEGIVQICEKKRTKLGEFLFNDERGLLRKDQRFRRLFVQPAVIGLIGALITYMILLNAVTKKANVRAGHS